MRRPSLPQLGVLAVALTLASLARGEVRPGDRMLLVSTRPVGCSTNAARLATGVYSAERIDGRWTESQLDPLLASLDTSAPIVFYVHGNQIDAPDARRRGLDVYHRFVRCAEDERSIQFVIFSWCSSKVPGLLKDYREKAARTRPVGWQFAWLLDKLPSGSQIGVMGYSYGARVTSGAAHLLAGRSLGGLRLDATGEHAMRAVFLAAAYDACWNSPRAYHGGALDRIKTLLTTVNPNDPAMKFYKWVPKKPDPPALGGIGPTGLTHEQASRVRLMRVANSVGRSHDLYDYLRAPGLMRKAWRRLTFSEESAPAPVVVASR